MMELLESRLLLATTPNDPLYRHEWGAAATAAPAAWEITTGSAAVVVADIDTGIDYEHPDLYQNIWINQNEVPAAIRKAVRDTDADKRITFYDLNSPVNQGKVADVDGDGRIDAGDLLARVKAGGWSNGRDEGANGYIDDIIGWDFADDDNDPMDHHGHGTHTAGTIGAVGNNNTGVAGVAWKVSLMAIKVGAENGGFAPDSAIAQAIRYSADNGARVSNNSWGGSRYAQPLYDAVRYAGTKGQVFVAAVANDGWNGDSPSYGDYPANFALGNIMTVAATSQTGALAPFSNYGRFTVDVTAPGSGILSTYPNGGYTAISGTSMATPHVTGAIALMLARNPSLSPTQIRSQIINGADQNPSLIGRSVSGGELNIANALTNRPGGRVAATA